MDKWQQMLERQDELNKIAAEVGIQELEEDIKVGKKAFELEIPDIIARHTRELSEDELITLKERLRVIYNEEFDCKFTMRMYDYPERADTKKIYGYYFTLNKVQHIYLKE